VKNERKRELLETIKVKAQQFYNGEIEWIDSILKCY